ncbi:trypsin-like serine protease [Dyella halodurans]|uniref:Serine protease n=1 Tax=Dyella halodurans TaxID=1920171 RepID=A0ABV9C254_9GAMM|nr:trypsin-like serine protease [Dyella halodurans]
MATTKSSDRKLNKPPLSIDEVVLRDNIAATKKPPADTIALLTTRRLMLSGPKDLPKELQKALSDMKRAEPGLSLPLPPSTIIGLPGNTGERVPHKALAASAGTSSSGQPFKPDWAPLVYHPKIGAKPRQKYLRGLGGRRIVPTDNQSFIYGSDDRRVFYPSGYPWRCIGRVDVYPNADADNFSSWGSGVLIGDRLVLTAGHVPPVNPAPGTWKMRFTAGMYNGSAVDGPGAVSYVSDFKGYTGGLSGVDYAVLRLYEPLGTHMGYFGWKTYDDSWTGGDYWWLAGYPFDIAAENSPSYQAGIAVLDQDSDQGGLELEHHGDTASGDSGGPFWGFWDEGPYVVGTVSGHEHVSGPSWAGGEDNNIAAGGSPLSNLLAWARSNWPA